ncbi:hypothetical protein JTB14_021913 [Gonioctena quinquepunctata]|nr:hypothetical protein JTB14_021913 [Gonioctena quinquepunctata]
MFCFHFKHKTAAILMAAFNLSIGIFGTITFAVRIQCTTNCSPLLDDIGEDYLIFSIFHLIASIPLMSALIWERAILIVIYEGIHISTLTAFLTHTVIFLRLGKTLYMIFIGSCFIIYCMYCVYLFYLELKLKKRSRLGTVQYIEAVYFCNSNIQ